MIDANRHLQIGSFVFEGLDQIDLTGPFEVLSRIPNSTYKVYGISTESVRDARGLIMTPDAPLKKAPLLDLLHIPGGPGQEALMENSSVLNFIQKQSEHAEIVFSVCTGALLLGAAGLSGIDGALIVASLLRGEIAAQVIQLYMQYAPEPPFNAGTPATAPAEVLEKARAASKELFERRKVTAGKISEKLGITTYNSNQILN